MKTKDGQHPEDAIFHAAMFLQGLSEIQEERFLRLIDNLRLNEKGELELFDYLYNVFPNEQVSFEECLAERGIKFENLCYKPGEDDEF